MKRLKKQEREFLEALIDLKGYKHGDYWVFMKQIDNKRFKIKRSRAVMQLFLNKRLEIWEIVHHKDGDKLNDNIENLEVIDTRNFNSHTSLHHAGVRYAKTKN